MVAQSDLRNLTQRLDAMGREHFRQVADLAERVGKLERENKALRRRLDLAEGAADEREMAAAS